MTQVPDTDKDAAMNSLISRAVASVAEFHPGAGRRLKLAFSQLESAQESEEYQQVGILVRDAWIELVQKLWAVTDNINKSGVGPNDVKGMLGRLGLGDEETRIAKSVYDLSLKTQHDRNATYALAKSCTEMAITAMDMLLNLLRQDQGFVGQTYHRCPLCGSLDLLKTVEGVQDYDGHPIPMNYLVCQKCGWRIEETGLTSPPFS